MTENIFWKSEFVLSFRKIKWDSSELSLAKCLNFSFDELTQEISADLRIATKNSLFEFFKKCFVSLTESPLHKNERDKIFGEIKIKYNRLWEDFNSSILHRINTEGYSFYKHQKEAMFYCVNKQYNLLAMDMGTGKAQPLDADIISEKGVVKMGELKVGDKIFASNGELCSITHIYPQGEKDVYKIMFTDGSSTECCGEHLWAVQDKDDRFRLNRFRIVNTDFLKNNLGIIHKNRNGSPRWNIPKCGIIKFGKKQNTIHPYLMGALLGNGCFRSVISISSNDKYLIEKLRLLLPEKIIIKKQKGRNYSWNICPDETIEKCGGGNNYIINQIRAYGLFGKLSHEKHIPDSFKFSSFEDRIELLRGLLDTDGHVSHERSRISYSSVSWQLINDVRFLVESMGGLMSIKKDERPERRTCYVGHISLDIPGYPIFTLPRKLNRVNKKGRDISRRIERIEFVGRKICQCITIDSPDHLYLTNNFIVTHNSITAATLSKLWSCERTLIVCPSVMKWTWYRDLAEKFGFNKLFFTIIDKSKKKSLQAFVDERFVIINYEMLKRRFEIIAEKDIHHIIYDECHFLKNTTSDNFSFADKLMKKFPEAKVTMLSGTPVKNRVNDMFAYLKLSKHPLGKNYSFFLREYTNTEFGRGGLRVIGSKNLDDLYSKLSNFMIRYRLEDCVDMPEKVISKLYLSMEEYKDEYNAVIDEMMQRNEKIDIHGSLATLSIVVSKAKIPGIIQLADSIIEEGRKVVIFSSYLSPMDDMEMRYKDKCVRIDGKVDSFEKDKRIQKFWNDDTVNVFLGQTAAAGVGINLTNCNDIIFANFPFTITDMEQAISRCFRIGQKNKVKVYLPIAEGSLDEYVYELLVDKSKDINNLIDKGKSGVTDYANIENKLFSMLMEKYKPKEASPTDII